MKGLVFALILLNGCAVGIPKDALRLQPETLRLRELQTRVYETTDEKKILSASLAVLQDLGFNLDESESKLGVIVASKDRSVWDTGQFMAKIFIGALTGTQVPIDEHHKVRVSLVTRPVQSYVHVRVTFQRLVWNDQQQLWKIESLNEESIYREFFDQLSKAVFLEAHPI
jgi:hypothetical protein